MSMRRLAAGVVGLAITAAVCLTCGCGENFSVGKTAPKEEDPRASFEVLIKSVVPKMQTMYDAEEAAERAKGEYKDWTRRRILPDTVRYDVRKSDSLVTPYEALLKYDYVSTRFTRQIYADYKAENGDFTYTETIKYGYRDGRWEKVD